MTQWWVVRLRGQDGWWGCWLCVAASSEDAAVEQSMRLEWARERYPEIPSPLDVYGPFFSRDGCALAWRMFLALRQVRVVERPRT